MKFRQVNGKRIFSENEFKGFCQKVGRVQDIKNNKNLENRFLFISPYNLNCSSADINVFHEKFFSWAGGPNPIFLNVKKKTFSTILDFFFPWIKNNFLRNLFLFEKMYFLVSLIFLSLFFCLYNFFYKYHCSGDKFFCFLSKIKWPDFFCESLLFGNFKYWGIALTLSIVTFLFRKIDKTTSDEEKVLEKVLKKLEKENFDKILTKILSYADNRPFVLYIDDLESLSDTDTRILFGMLNNDRIKNMNILFFIVGFSFYPSSIRCEFIDSHDYEEKKNIYIFELDGARKKEKEVPVKFKNEIEKFYKDFHPGFGLSENWTFFETFYFYGVASHLTGMRSITSFKELVKKYSKWALNDKNSFLKYLLKEEKSQKKIEEILDVRNFSDDLKKRYLSKLMNIEDNYIDMHTLALIKNKIPPKLKFYCNLLILEYFIYYLKFNSFNNFSLEDYLFIGESIMLEIIDFFTCEKIENRLCSSVEKKVVDFVKLLEEKGRHELSVKASVLILLCFSKGRGKKFSEEHFDAIQSIFIFEKIDSSVLQKVKNSISPDSKLFKILSLALGKEVKLNENFISISKDSLENHLNFILKLNRLEFLEILVKKPAYYINSSHDDYWHNDDYIKKYKSFLELELTLGGGFNLQTWAKLTRIRFCLNIGAYDKLFKDFCSIIKSYKQLEENQESKKKDSFSLVWERSVCIFLIIDLLECIVRVSGEFKVPDDWPQEVVERLNQAFEMVGTFSQIKKGDIIYNQLLDKLFKFIEKLKLFFYLRGERLKFFLLLISFYELKLSYLIATPFKEDAFDKKNLMYFDSNIQDRMRNLYTFFSNIRDYEDVNYGIWPSFYYEVSCIRLCIENNIHCSLSYESLKKFHDELSLRRDENSNELNKYKKWLFNIKRLYLDDIKDDFFNDFIEESYNEIMKSNSLYEEFANGMDSMIFYSYFSENNETEKRDNLGCLIDNQFQSYEEEIVQVVKEEGSLNSIIYFTSAAMQWFRYYSDLTIDKPTVSFEEILGDKDFAKEQNYGYALLIYTSEAHISRLSTSDLEPFLLNLLKYLQIYKKIEIEPFTSIVWIRILFNFFSFLSDFKMYEDVVNKNMDIFCDIVPKIWLNYMSLELLYKVIGFLEKDYCSIKTRTDEPREIYIPSSYFNLKKTKSNIELIRIKRLQFKAIKNNARLNDYRYICKELYSLFENFSFFRKRSKIINLNEWGLRERSKKGEIVTIIKDKMIEIRKLVKNQNYYYEVVPVLSKIDTECLKRADEDIFFKEKLEECSQLWTLIGYVFVEELYAKIEKEENIDKNLKKEVRDFLNLLKY